MIEVLKDALNVKYLWNVKTTDALVVTAFLEQGRTIQNQKVSYCRLNSNCLLQKRDNHRIYSCPTEYSSPQLQSKHF